MDSMIISAPIGYAMIMHYENEPYTRIKMIECKTCDGLGKEFYSSCCGEQVINQKCSHCGDDCLTYSDKCYTCNGEGEIEL